MEAVEKSKNSVVGVSHEDSDVSSKKESSAKKKKKIAASVQASFIKLKIKSIHSNKRTCCIN